MTLSNCRHVAGLVFLLATVLVMALVAYARGTVRVGGWSLRANGNLARNFEYVGSCPVDLKFGWSVLGTEPTEVVYTFERSDGAHQAHSQTLMLPDANRSGFMYYDWRLGLNNREFADFHGWVELLVESPNRVSQRINFTLHCR
jgi:hypothetical protein